IRAPRNTPRRPRRRVRHRALSAERLAGSFAVHPLPDRPEAKCGANKDEGRAPEHTAMEGAIERAADERAYESRRDDRPSEPPYHRERAAYWQFSCPQPVLAPAMRPFDGFFQFAFLGRRLVIAMLLPGCHDRAPRLFRRPGFERPVGGPQVTIDLPNRGVFQAEQSRSGGALGLDVLRHRGENLAAQMSQVSVYDRLAGCYLDDLALPDAQHAAAHGDVVLDAAAITPSHDADRERGDKIRMAELDTEGAAGIFGANVAHGTFIKRDLGGCGDDQPHRHRIIAALYARRAPFRERLGRIRPCKMSF